MSQPNLKSKLSELEKSLDTTSKSAIENDRKIETIKTELKELKKDLSNLTNQVSKLVVATVGVLDEAPIPAPKVQK